MTLQSNNNPQERAYLTIEQVADHLGVDHRTIRQILKRGEMKSIRVGRLIRIPAWAITEWEQAQFTSQGAN